MTVKYVDSVNGNDGNTGDAFNDAYATIKYAIENGIGPAPADGDKIYVDYRHTEQFTASETWTLLSSSSNVSGWGDGIQIVSVDFDSASHTESRRMTGFVGSNEDNFGLTLTNGAVNTHQRPLFEFHGIRWRFHNTGSSARINLPNAVNLRFTDCRFEIIGSTGGLYSNLTRTQVEVFGGEWDFAGGTSCQILQSDINVQQLLSNWTGLQLLNVPADPGELIRWRGNVAFSGISDTRLTGMDLSGITEFVVNTSSSGERAQITLFVTGCKLETDASAITWGNAAVKSVNKFRVEVYSSTPGDAVEILPGLTWMDSVSGSIEHSRTEHISVSPPNDGADDYSWKMIPTVDTGMNGPLSTPFVTLKHPGGTQSCKVHFATSTAWGALLDSDAYIEVLSPGAAATTGSATVQQGVSTRSPGGSGKPAATSPYLSDDPEGWDGTGSVNTYQLTVPVTADVPGVILLKFHWVKPGTDNVWFSPKIELV